MREDEKGDFAGSAGAVRAFLNTPEKFPGRITAADKTVWIVNDNEGLQRIGAELDAHCDGGKLLKVETNATA